MLTKILLSLSVALGVVCGLQYYKIKELQASSQFIPGPERIVRRVILKPDGTKETQEEVTKGPAQALKKPLQRYVGVMAGKHLDETILKVGIRLNDRIDLGYAIEPQRMVHRLDLSYRF